MWEIRHRNKKQWISMAIFIVMQTLFCYSIGYAQTQTVSGTVYDASSGSTLPGVNVVVKGTTHGTSTEANGTFSLDVSSLRDTLVFSFIGYKTKAVPIKGRTSIDVKLASQAIQGNEMVVVGYGSQKQQDVTGSVGTIQMKSVDSQPIVGANEALSGQIAGVQVNTTNGIPGGGPEVHIRGVGDIGAGSNPLYVVDGYPLPESSSSQVSNPLNNIPASDIASISVLKGPSATAIYGSRGSNGVVLITTKEGKKGKLKFHADAYTGWQSIPDQEVTPMMNARQFATFMKQSIEDHNRVSGSNNAIPKEYQNPSQYGKGTDWFSELTRVAPQQNFNFSASGGNDNITSYFSGSVLRQKGVVIGSDYNRVSFRANVHANLSPKLSLGVNFSPNYSFGHNGVTGAVGRGLLTADNGGNPGYFGEWEVLSPLVPVHQSDGSYTPMVGSPGLFAFPNPVLALNQMTHKKNTTHLLGNTFVEYDFLKDLSFRSTFNVNWENSNEKIFYPSTIGGVFNPPPTIPSGSYGQDKFLNWANENRLTYDHDFKGGHSVKLMADVSEQRQVTDNVNFNGDQFADNSIKTLNAASVITGGTYASSWTLVSYLGRLNYSYKDKYLLTATVRRDGSSRFGPNNRWGTFPSLALGWRITNEPWMEKYSSWLNNLKIRASYGISGNNQIGNFTYESQLNSSNYVFGGSLASGKVVNSLSNPSLAWERTAEADLGLNAGFINGRIKVDLDFYRSRTKDLLLNLNIPESSGFSTTIKNIGEVQNKGFELGVHTKNVVKHNFMWSTNFNFAMNRNKTLSLGPSGAPIQGGTSGEGHPTNITKIGKPVGMFYGYKFLGLYNQSDINNSNVAKFPGAIPGNMKVADINGDGKITPVSDFTTIGNPYPDFTYGITNTLRYKGLSLNLVITGSYGAERMKATYESLHNIDGVFNVPVEMENRYRSPQNPGDGRHPTTAGSAFARVMYRDVSTLNVFNASYLWFKNITLGYTLPKSITNGSFQNIQLYTSIQNAFIITPYPNGNPVSSTYSNAQSYGGALSPGIDWNPYPTPRVITVGIKVDY